MNMCRGNVEESLQIVKDLLTANDVGYDDGWIIHNIIYILKKVIHVLIEKIKASEMLVATRISECFGLGLL